MQEFTITTLDIWTPQKLSILKEEKTQGVITQTVWVWFLHSRSSLDIRMHLKYYSFWKHTLVFSVLKI